MKGATFSIYTKISISVSASIYTNIVLAGFYGDAQDICIYTKNALSVQSIACSALSIYTIIATDRIQAGFPPLYLHKYCTHSSLDGFLFSYLPGIYTNIGPSSLLRGAIFV